MMECYYDISDDASCEANVVKPIMKYVKLGIDESRKYYKKVNQKYLKQIKEWRSEAVEFVKSFTHEDISFIKGTDYTSIAKKSIKLWKSSSIKMSDISSAGLSFASGVYVASKSSVVKVFVFPFFSFPSKLADIDLIPRFQKDIKDTTSLKKAFGEIYTILKKAGTLGFAASAVNLAWEVDSVFIAKASKNINDQKPADIDLAILGKDARTCDKEGTCYFFIVAQKIENVKNKKWEAVKGLHAISQYDMTSLEFAKSAVWFQNQFGGYAAKPNGTELLQSFQAKDTQPRLGYYVSAPVINLDKAQPLSADKVVKPSSENKASSEETLLSVVAKEVDTLKDWPYAKMWS